ncbi:CpsD/CapB family tyrosine-protein kinase [Polynucleobacter paneuropaeus]|jgi:Mrp family chromosome partitioning ATPase|nr:CpsD/CapB family tyrosine-protein kinase [Polynucleobacter paneuropaeus]MBT8612031.1 CpsD/CapB family tyrosine-protein kinase [Polynucleobacter paneuropaeus]
MNKFKFLDRYIGKHQPPCSSGDKWVKELRAQILSRCSVVEKAIFVSLIPAENMRESATVSVSLAESFAKSGKSVLLLDFDLNVPKVSSLIKNNSPKEFICNSTYSLHSSNFFTHEKYPNFYYFSSDSSVRNYQDLLASDAFGRFMGECVKSFEIVISLTTPADICSSYMLASKNADIAILLAKQDSTKVNPLYKVISNLKLIDINNPFWLFINGDF